jgi:putative heme-binding domain-containing protein
LTTALADPHPRVRFRACLASAAAKLPEKTDALAALSLRQGESIWTFRAILLGIGRNAPQLLKQLGPRLAQWPDEAAEGLARLAAQHGLTPADLGPAAPTPAVIRGLALSLTKDSGNAWQEALAKWSAAPASEAVAPLFALSRSLGSNPSGALATLLAAAAQTAVQQDDPAAERIRAIAWLAYGSDPAPLWKVIDSPSPPDLLRAAFESLRQQSPTDLPQQLLQRWRTLHPSLRPPVVRLLVDRSAYHDALVTALEQKTVTVSELNLDLEQRRELIRWSKPVMAARARKFITDDEYTNRRSSVTEMLAKLPASGDAAAGRQIFLDRCAQCHQWNDLGHAVGPSLLGMSHRSTEDLLSHIMDPNMALHPEYLACTIKTTRGDTVAGLLKVETPASVTLLQPMAIATTVSRSEIARMETLTTSLMPEGLESGLSPADLKNLILFLQSKP